MFSKYRNVDYAIPPTTLYNKTMTDSHVESIALAALGIGKVFDQPYVGVVAQGSTTQTWFEGSGVSCLSWLQSLNFNAITTLTFSYEIAWTILKQIHLPSQITFIFCSPNYLEPHLTIQELRAQGHKVEIVSDLEALELNHVWYENTSQDMPFIAQSFGMSLDGKIATRTGDSKYITGKEVLTLIHQLRHRYQAILVGINTVLLDHPQLTTRLKNGQGHSPIRIILDTHLRIAFDEPLVNNAESSTWIVTSSHADPSKVHAFKNKGATIIQVPLAGDHLDLRMALITLKRLGIHSVLVEGGATIHGALIDARLTHRVYASISPIIIGGEDAKTPIAGQGFATLLDSLRLRFIHIKTYGDDVFITATIKGNKV